MGLIWQHFDKFQPQIDKFVDEERLAQTFRMIDNEFSDLMSPDRRQLMKNCLQIRQAKMAQQVKG